MPGVINCLIDIEIKIIQLIILLCKLSHYFKVAFFFYWNQFYFELNFIILSYFFKGYEMIIIVRDTKKEECILKTISMKFLKKIRHFLGPLKHKLSFRLILKVHGVVLFILWL
jgi:hypothetical protein